ncbi:PIN/TRAM domain-containing protein [Candidatus Omnitrophota bacterium]
MTLHLIRVLFLFISMVMGFQVADMTGFSPLHGAGAGLLASAIIIVLEVSLRRVSLRGLSSLVFGLALGILFALLIGLVLKLLPLSEVALYLSRIILILIFAYLGAMFGLQGKDEFSIIIPYVRFRRQDQKDDVVILDTSAIIDGRVVDIYKTQFLESRVVIPRFVLKELQQVADSSDPIKRQRGRRGLELLRSIQKDPSVELRIHEEDIVGGGDVDAKLVKLAKVLEAKIFTTDFNLNRIAGLEGVKVLNVNELANALKPVVFPGESMEVRLLKEGKEHNQAIAYLDDGTMIVIEDGRRFIGQLVKVVVTSVLQTQAGRMIFTKLEHR